MSKEIVATQRLADIKALLDYVRAGIDNIVDDGKVEQLDGMGQATMTILTTLRDIQEGIEHSEGRLVELHSEITKETFENLEKPLEELLEDINNNTTSQKDFLNEIVQSYQSYESFISQMEESLKESKEDEERSYEDINQKIDNISGEVSKIGEQVPKEAVYQASLKEINNSINRMVESERLNNDRHQETLSKVSGELAKAQELLTETNEALDSISQTYERSTGRLSVLDLKLDTLTDILLTDDEEIEDIGGMDNE